MLIKYSLSIYYGPMKTEQTNMEWAKAIYAHAQENYNVSRWDEIVECYTLEDLAEICEDYEIYNDALREVEKMVGYLKEQESNCSYE